jgi:choline kinase
VTLTAVVLAAGSGRRLRPLTDRVPKCLIEVGGRTLVDRLLDGLATAGVARVVIVTGHLSDRVEAHVASRREGPHCECVRNPHFVTTNNAASLAAAREAIGGGGFLLCDGDLIVSADPLPDLMAHPGDCVLVVDPSVPWNEEAMKVSIGADRSVRRVSKHLSAGESGGESIGLQKIGQRAAPMLWDVLSAVLESDAASAYYEDAFQKMIDRGVKFETQPVVPGSWMEIDEAADLAEARARFGP